MLDRETMPPPAKSLICPLTLNNEGNGTACRSIYENCPKYTVITFENPSDGKAVPYAGCSEGVLPLLLCDQTNRLNQLGAAIESLRNVVAAQQPKTGPAVKKVMEHLSRVNLPAS